MWQSYKGFCSDRMTDMRRAFYKFGYIRAGIGVFWSFLLWYMGSVVYLCVGMALLFARCFWWLLRVVIFLVRWVIAKLLGKTAPAFPRPVKSEVSSMSGEEFEQFIARKLRAKGYSNVQLTPVTGDYGVDITATKRGVKYAFQCKRYAAPVGVKAVQEVFSGSRKYGADRAVVVTNSTYTPNAKTLANDLGVTLLDLELLDAALDD